MIEELNLTYRPQQLYLAEIILEQLMHSEKAMIEAPLGSGKSIAYLLAAIMYNIVYKSFNVPSKLTLGALKSVCFLYIICSNCS